MPRNGVVKQLPRLGNISWYACPVHLPIPRCCAQLPGWQRRSTAVFTALFVETPETRELTGENLRRLRDNLRLAEQLGAQIATVYGDDPAVQIAEYARVSGITKIVIGRTNHKASPLLKSRTLVDQLTRLAGDIDVYIIPDNQPIYHRKWMHKPRQTQPVHLLDILKVLLITSAASLINLGFYNLGLREANIITVYLLGVLIAAVWTPGHFYGALASAAQCDRIQLPLHSAAVHPGSR